jgi:hypothetical protein
VSLHFEHYYHPRKCEVVAYYDIIPFLINI